LANAEDLDDKLEATNQFPLRTDFKVNLDIPSNLTRAEADRLASWIRLLPTNPNSK
jgi:hypothetical protein